jgi:2-iminobutanoate/2-iminopropanoate deaminase
MTNTFGPYTPIRKAGSTYYVSGQVPVGASQHTPSSVAEQTSVVLDNMRACIESEGLSMNDVVKITIYLKNMDDFAAVNEVYQTYFQPPRPARSCVEVSDLPHIADTGLLVEMDAIVHKDMS